MGENYLDMAAVIVVFFTLGILLSRLGGCWRNYYKNQKNNLQVKGT